MLLGQRATATHPPSSAVGPPGTVGLAARGAVGALGPAADGDGLLVLPAVLAPGRLIDGLGRDGAAVAAVRIAPGGGGIGAAGLERSLGGLGHRQTIGAVERATDLVPHPCAEQGAGGDGGELAGSRAELRAEQAAGGGADQGAAEFLLAPALGGAGAERDGEHKDHRDLGESRENSHDRYPPKGCASMARTGGIWLLPIRFAPVRGDILHKPAEPALSTPFIWRSSSPDRWHPPFSAVFLRPGGAVPIRAPGDVHDRGDGGEPVHALDELDQSAGAIA